MASFQPAFQRLLSIEGTAFTNLSTDRGGATRFGITKATLAGYRRNRITSDADVESLTVDEAAAIYEQNYWDRLSLDKVNSQQIAYSLFDQGVNCGPLVAAKRAQKVLAQLKFSIPQDGVMGPLTTNALNSSTLNEKRFLFEFCMESLRYYAKIVKKDPTQVAFILGWTNRIGELMEGIVT